MLLGLALAASVLAGLACVAGGGAVVGAARVGDQRDGNPLDVLVWRAGHPLPPGLPAARVAELEIDAGRALEELHRMGRVVETRLRSLLEATDTPAELWSAAARASASLELYSLSDVLARALDSFAPPQRTIVAREALHDLYGRWFTTEGALEPYRASVTGGPGTRLLLESNAWEEARSRERLLAELAHTPSSAAAWLADPDPLVRSGAARILAQVFTRADGDGAATLELLVSHLEAEHEPQAFHEGLLACLEPLGQADPDLPTLGRLRAVLLEIVHAPADPRASSAAFALARLPWRMQGSRDAAHVLSGADSLGEMLQGLAEADRQRGANDPDPLVATFAALRVLCDAAVAGGLIDELRGSRSRESALAILQDPAQDEAVRSMAAAALGPLCRPSDGELLSAVLRDDSTTASVKHALLGSLRAILPGFGADEAGTDALLRAIAELTGDPDADLRRRALSLCADEDLELFVRRLDPSFLVARLASETNQESTGVLLHLIQRFGRADMLGPLLSSERFDRMARDPSRLEELAVALEALTRGSARGAMNAASRLAEVSSEETSLTRLRHALQLVADLDDAAAFELYPLEHRAICSWTWRIYRAGVAPCDVVTQGLLFEQRLLQVHLARAAKAGGREAEVMGPFEVAHLAALLSADLFLGGVGRGTKAQVESAFEGAFALAEEDELERLVLRDRARFRSAANEAVKAMADYRKLLALGEGDLLGISDLRTAVELLERLAEPSWPGRSSAAGEASDLLERILQRPAWRSEPASVRMQDLRSLVRFNLDSRDRSRLLGVESRLADLPLTQVEVALEGEPSPVWIGLTRDPAWFQELLDLRARVRIALRELEAQG